MVIIFLVVIISLSTPKATLSALDAEEHFVTGNEYLANHQYSEAIIEYKEALKLNPYYKEAYLNLGKAYQSKQLFKDAISQYKKAIKLDRKYVDAYINLGICYEKQNLLTKAKTNLEKAIELNPVNAEGHFYLANILYKGKKIKESIEEYIQTTKIDSKHFQAYIKLGEIYFKDLIDDEKAIYYFNLAKKTKPKDETAYIKLGKLYSQKGLFDKAILEYKKAVNLNPENPTTLTQFGLLYLTTAEYQNALPLYEKLVKITPDNPLAHYTLGITYENLGMFQEALNEFETTLDTEDEIALFRQERIILELNRAKVSSIWRKKSSQKHLISAENYLKEGFLTLATYEFKRSVLLDPQNPNIRLSLAKFYELLERKQLAIEELIKVVELDSNNLEAKDRLEKLYFEQERSLSHKEKIDTTQIPASEISVVVCAYTTNSIHYGIEEVALRMLLPLLKQFPHITLIDEILILNDEKDVIDIGQDLKAKFALWVKVNEDEEMIEITAELIDLKTIKKILKTYLPIKGKHRLIKALSFLAEKVINTVPIQGVIMKIADDKVVINLGNLHGIKPNQILEVWKREDDLAPFTQKVKKPELIGKIKILEVEPTISKATIITPMTLRFIGINDVVKLP
ncbi:MAG: tetratricopeptide repeat protein [bacterium]